MTEKELRDYWKLYNAGWQLLKEFSAPDSSDEYWERLRDKAVELDHKYNSQFFREIAIAILTEMERYYENHPAQ